jgi:hypothetical protein
VWPNKVVLLTSTAGYLGLVIPPYYAVAIAIFGRPAMDNILSWISSSSGSTLLAGIAGAAIASLISLRVAERASRETLERDALARRDAAYVSGVRVVLEAIEIASRANTILGYLTSSKERLREGMQLFAVVTPVAFGKPNRERIDMKDFVPFMQSGGAELLNKFMLCRARVEAMEDAMSTYCKFRDEWDAFAPQFTKVLESGLAFSEPPAHLLAEAEIRAAKMNSLLESMFDRAPDIVKDTNLLVEEVVRAAERYHGPLGFGIEFARSAPPPASADGH